MAVELFLLGRRVLQSAYRSTRWWLGVTSVSAPRTLLLSVGMWCSIGMGSSKRCSCSSPGWMARIASLMLRTQVATSPR